MAWKIEKWLSEIFPGNDKLILAYQDLSNRELAVVAASVMDLALAELLSKRLVDYPKEYEEFLGLDADGRAPCGSFGARIQLALLLDVITPQEAAMLRDIKNIRNKFAHRVKCTFTATEVVPLLEDLYDRLLIVVTDGKAPDKSISDAAKTFRVSLRTEAESGARVLRGYLMLFQSYFLQLSGKVERVATKR